MSILGNTTVDSVQLLAANAVQFQIDLTKNPGLTIENVRQSLEEFCELYRNVHGWETQFLGGKLFITVVGVVNPEILAQVT